MHKLSLNVYEQLTFTNEETSDTTEILHHFLSENELRWRIQDGKDSWFLPRIGVELMM